jgi:hypothetical protein
MYIDGKISEEEIARVPSLAKEHILDHLKQIRVQHEKT